MTIQTFLLDPNAASYTDDQIVGKVNSAAAQITRVNAVSAAARPIASGEVGSTELAAGAVGNTELASTAAKDNLDALGDTSRGYIKTDPQTGEFKITTIQRDAAGKTKFAYDDVAV